jgi:hypothetical protein
MQEFGRLRAPTPIRPHNGAARRHSFPESPARALWARESPPRELEAAPAGRNRGAAGATAAGSRSLEKRPIAYGISFHMDALA